MVFIPKRPIPPPVQAPAAPQIPRSLLQSGFLAPGQARKRGTKFRGLMLATEGRSDTGKTEFAMSAPGPGAIIACDRGFDAVFDNQNPPPTRRGDFGIKPVHMPMATDYQRNTDYLPHYQNFYREVMTAAQNPEVRTLVIDGDNVSWDLQRLAEWGKLQGIYPQTKYAEPKAARQSFYYNLWQTGKIIITTNMMQDSWRDMIDPATGMVVRDEKGEPKRERSGESEARGFPDQEYIWQIRIRMLYRAATTKKFMGKSIVVPQQWGLRVVKCKPKPELIGTELWGDSCNFQGLVQLVYPHIGLEEWGY